MVYLTTCFPLRVLADLRGHPIGQLSELDWPCTGNGPRAVIHFCAAGLSIHSSMFTFRGVPDGCSAIDGAASKRRRFLLGEADFRGGFGDLALCLGSPNPRPTTGLIRGLDCPAAGHAPPPGRSRNSTQLNAKS